MTKQNFLPYAHQSINAQDIEAVENALKEDLITRGPQVEAFEREFAQYCGAKYAVALSTGSAALSAAYYAARVSPYDRLITTPNTYITTAGSAIQLGAMPIFVDIERQTGSVDVEMMAATANAPVSRGKPILAPVHFAGIAVDMQRLDGLLTNPDAVVIEDAAHAVGSFYSSQGPRVGSCAWSHMTIFSLHPAKTMTTGEGGIVTTNHEEYYHALQLFRNNCIERDPKYLNEEPRPWYYEVVDLSNNYNFTTFQAALGRSQLSRIETFVTKRRQLMQQYREKFKDFSSIKLFTDDRDPYTAFHLCVAQIDFAHCKTDRKSVMDQLKEEGIGTQVHYIPLYRHPYFKKKLGDLSLYFPETEAYYEQALSLPLYFDLSLDDVDRIAETLIRILKHSLLRPS